MLICNRPSVPLRPCLGRAERPPALRALDTPAFVGLKPHEVVAAGTVIARDRGSPCAAAVGADEAAVGTSGVGELIGTGWAAAERHQNRADFRGVICWQTPPSSYRATDHDHGEASDEEHLRQDRALGRP